MLSGPVPGGCVPQRVWRPPPLRAWMGLDGTVLSVALSRNLHSCPCLWYSLWLSFFCFFFFLFCSCQVVVTDSGWGGWMPWQKALWALAVSLGGYKRGFRW